MPDAGKILITGTGRAGTTFLVRLLTELGCDTGFARRNLAGEMFAHCAAGLEWDLRDPACPRIVKNPALCDTLPGLLATGAVRIEHAFIPMRALHDAAASRCRVGPAGVPGGIWDAVDLPTQKAALAEKFHGLVHALVEAGVPITFLAFPRLVTDADYAFARLGWLVPSKSAGEFAQAFARMADPSLVHAFTADPGLCAVSTTDAYEPARHFKTARARRRRRRHLARWAVWILSVATAAAAGVAWGGLG